MRRVWSTGTSGALRNPSGILGQDAPQNSVIERPDASCLWAVETPPGFCVSLTRSVHAANK